ncbi:mitochondrial assembly of ribosomal large subunit protein 1 [Microtus ochrogaster]|uniref:Mitochondrial assembly of ribosomal large subunit protein 1 n=1 Tax=Microtus ochrogaster TaxID=79684 RepID=A0ABM0L862_MICOH|nr:mitochondrial assembly of ribosomal large subunit protein 1 [Microtus ochrogaster]
MGPGWSPARRLWPLLWRTVVSQRADPAASSVLRLPRLAEQWLSAGPAACPTPSPARGLHRGPQPQERPDGEARLQPGAADRIGSKFDIDMLVSLLRQENARDICVIKVPPEMKYADYFVIGSGTSSRHLHAMAYYIVKMYKHLKCRSDPYVKIEGKDTDDWLCVDFGSMVIHLMLPGTRETYELEKLWTLRSFDDQLAQMEAETLPEDFILGLEDDASSPTPVEFKRE